ncbi:hypothetical protein ID866_11241 [Astraeus odoratus]|nr:hypothetical protein ID866_11241 [Astraeus odoratus]
MGRWSGKSFMHYLQK